MRQEVARRVHQVDGRAVVGHGDMHVHAEDEQRSRELLELLDDVLVALAGEMTWSIQLEKGCVPAAATARPARSAAGHSSLRMRSISCSNCCTSAQIGVPTSTIDWCISRLMWSPSDSAPAGEQFAHMRSQGPCGGVYNLKFFLDADGESMGHAATLSVRLARNRNDTGYRRSEALPLAPAFPAQSER